MFYNVAMSFFFACFYLKTVVRIMSSYKSITVIKLLTWHSNNYQYFPRRSIEENQVQWIYHNVGVMHQQIRNRMNLRILLESLFLQYHAFYQFIQIFNVIIFCFPTGEWIIRNSSSTEIYIRIYLLSISFNTIAVNL